MKTNLVLMEESKIDSLGFDRTLFLGKDFVLVVGENKKELLKKISKAKQQGLKVVVRVSSEEILRFVVEKTAVNMIIGQEKINLKDSVHFLRGGLDQVSCKICAEKGIIVGFSFGDILSLNGVARSKLLGRMKFNIKLCKKYGVKCYFGSFADDFFGLRSSHDLQNFWEVLGGIGNCLEI